jgi:carboxyl-terminal processing protease
MNKTLRYGILAVFMILLFAGAFGSGVIVGWVMPESAKSLVPGIINLPGISHTAINPQTTAAPGDKEALFKPFWEAWDIVQGQYVDQPVDEVKLMRGAIRGMMAALDDPHSSYMDPDQYRQQTTPLEGEYEGIGAWVDITGEYLKIISPMPNSPAAAAGVKAGDQVIAVDGEDMKGIDGNLVLRHILGPANSEVHLTIKREGQDPFDVTIVRAKIKVPSVDGKMLDHNIAYVQLFTYGDKSDQEIRDTLKELMAKKPDGLILDLRNNGGGLLTSAVAITSEFLPGNQILMYEEFSDKTRRTFKTQNGGLATDIPLVVLVNKGTASAAEITSGAIQDYGRGKLVGETTYGKGSVQNWIPLQNDQGAVRVTIARWLTPKERQIMKLGLDPDVTVTLTEEDVKANHDIQLDKAIELLTK